jgi:molybdopterin-biosynthesis enzyme MoeA-like protein
VALIGQPSPDDVYQLAADLLERNARLREETRKAIEDKNHYRSRFAAEVKKRKAAA